MLPGAKYTDDRWKRRVQRKVSCVDCKPVDRQPTVQCKVCKKEFEQTQWDNRYARPISCRGCRHP
eukprot:10928246-Karenia_brevis.AAC.1